MVPYLALQPIYQTAVSPSTPPRMFKNGQEILI
jgi:hypothetical protein